MVNFRFRKFQPLSTTHTAAHIPLPDDLALALPEAPAQNEAAIICNL